MSDIQVTVMAEGMDGLKPMATFALFAYNQEEYVAEAVRSAFAQTYRPLQVILSDDASTDRTFEVMQEVARDCPPDISLLLNRNPHNLGVARHINKVVGLARGEVLVLAAGDDISLPHRTGVSVEAVLNDGLKRRALHATVINMDASGHVLYERRNPYRDVTDSPRAVLERDIYLTGSSVAVLRGMYTYFPALNVDVVNEDKVTAFRCSFFGGAIYLDQPVTKYRLGVGVSTLHGDILQGREDPALESRYIRTGLMRRMSVLKQAKVDAASCILSGQLTPDVQACLDRQVKSVSGLLHFVENPTWLGFPSLFSAGGFNRKTLKIAILFLVPSVFRHYKTWRRNAVARREISA